MMSTKVLLFDPKYKKNHIIVLNLPTLEYLSYCSYIFQLLSGNVMEAVTKQLSVFLLV